MKISYKRFGTDPIQSLKGKSHLMFSAPADRCVRRWVKSPWPAKLSSRSAEVEQWHRPDWEVPPLRLNMDLWGGSRYHDQWLAVVSIWDAQRLGFLYPFCFANNLEISTWLLLLQYQSVTHFKRRFPFRFHGRQNTTACFAMPIFVGSSFSVFYAFTPWQLLAAFCGAQLPLVTAPAAVGRRRMHLSAEIPVFWRENVI